MDHEMMKVIEAAQKAHKKVMRLLPVGGKPLLRAMAERSKAEEAFEALCAERDRKAA